MPRDPNRATSPLASATGHSMMHSPVFRAGAKAKQASAAMELLLTAEWAAGDHVFAHFDSPESSGCRR